jgi:ligand-binding SRPBCC domain-containing protein
MKIYRLKTIQNLPISKSHAWDFLSNPKNLKRITPDYMGFKIINDIDNKMYAGQIIQYMVTPVMGIPTKWITEITHVDEGNYFVDEQRFGPYSLWHHKHFIKAIENGVEMKDIIDYKIPLGIIGRIAQPILVAPKLKEIFEYRKNALIELFGIYKS